MKHCFSLLLFLCFLFEWGVCGGVHTIPLVHRIHSAVERREVRAAAFRHPKAIKSGRFYFDNYPPQEFTVAVESGQADLWVLGADFTPLQDGQATYEESASNTSKYLDYFEGLSGQYDVYGDSYKDVVHIGTNITINQWFGDVDEIYGVFDEVAFGTPELSGVAGLYWGTYEPFKPLILGVFKSLNITEQRKFTLWLGPAKPPSQGPPEAALTLGGVDTDHCSPSVDFIPFEEEDAPLFTVFRFAAGSFALDGAQVTTVDTGFPSVAFQPDIYDAVYKQINPDYDWDLGLLTTPCAAAASLPSWVFSIGTKEYSVAASFYVVDLDIDGGTTCSVAFGLLDTDSVNGDLVLGNPFVRAICTVYDVDNNAIGFSALRT
ncbi:Peptidase A1 domain-containing protein [Aphelenchoides fujianensis]|nr:Peptidase A1 domain-containing protein [Aphelenchoides fujianensis]